MRGTFLEEPVLLLLPLALVLLSLGDALAVALDGTEVELLHAVDARVPGRAALGRVRLHLGLLDDVAAAVAVEGDHAVSQAGGWPTKAARAGMQRT